jgi:CRP/FNR family transcriptional regulator
MHETLRPTTNPPLALDTQPLADLAPRVLLWQGMEIGVQGQPCDSLYILAEGQVLLSRTIPEGQEHALYLLGPGDLFGEGALRPEKRWLVTARAVTEGAAHVLRASQFPRFAEYHPQLATQIVTLLCGRLERAHRRLDLVTSRSARTRLLGLLQVLADHHGRDCGEDRWLPLRLTHAELGEMIGLARETVGRALAELVEEGTLRREGQEGFWLRPGSARSRRRSAEQRVG